MDVIVETSAEIRDLTDDLILVSVRDIVLMPGIVMPLGIGNPAAAAALQEAARLEQHVVIILSREPFSDAPGLCDLHEIGTDARLLRYFTGRDNSHNAVLQGMGRVRIEAVLPGSQHSTVKVTRIEEPTERGPEIDARFHQLRERSLEIIGLIEQAPDGLAATVESIEQPGALADFMAGLLDLTPTERQKVLETVPLIPRLDLVISRLAYRHQVLKLSHDIGQQTRESMGVRQREYMLREQLKAI